MIWWPSRSRTLITTTYREDMNYRREHSILIHQCVHAYFGPLLPLLWCNNGFFFFASYFARTRWSKIRKTMAWDSSFNFFYYLGESTWKNWSIKVNKLATPNIFSIETIRLDLLYTCDIYVMINCTYLECN